MDMAAPLKFMKFIGINYFSKYEYSLDRPNKTKCLYIHNDKWFFHLSIYIPLPYSLYFASQQFYNNISAIPKTSFRIQNEPMYYLQPSLRQLQPTPRTPGKESPQMPDM